MSPAKSWLSMTGFQKKLGDRPPERQDRWIQFAQSLLTVAHQPRAGCIRLLLAVSFDSCITATLTLLFSITTPSYASLLPIPLALSCRTLNVLSSLV